MLIEGEINPVLVLAILAVTGFALAVLGFALAARAAQRHRDATRELETTEKTSDRYERRLYDILNSVPVALVETDTAGKFTFANRAAHQLLGRKDSELIGLRFHSATWGITYPDGRLIPPDLLPAARALRGQTVKGFQHVIANPGTRKRILVSVTAMPVLNGVGEVIGSTSALVETENLVQPEAVGDDLGQQYFDVAGVMLLVLGPDGKVRDVNLKGAEILGQTVEDVVGQNWIDAYLPEEQRIDAHAFFKDVVEGRRDMPEEGEGWIVRPDGARRLIAWRGKVLRDERGEVTGTLSSGQDITDAYETEQRCRESDSALRLAEEAGGVGVWSFNAKTGEALANAAMAEMWGVQAQTYADLERFMDRIHPEDRPEVEAALAAARGGVTPGYEAEYRIVRDGEVRWLIGRGEPIRDAQGEIVGMRGVNYDVTDLKAAQAAAQESEARFGEVADAAPALIWLSAPDGSVAWFNRRWLEFTGRPLEQELGHGWAESIHPDDYERCFDSYTSATREQASFRHEYRLRRHDGEWRWVRDFGEPRYDAEGRYVGHAGAAMDITDQKLAEDALRASEERFRSFAETSDDIVWMRTADTGRLSFLNTACERVWGVSRQALLDDPDAWRMMIHPDDRQDFDAGMENVRNGQSQVLQYRIIRPDDGQVIAVEARAFPILDENGVVVRVCGITRDVTASVQAREELERRVAERSRELEASLDERRKTEAALAQAQRLETVGRLTGGVAHDFNNLLTVVIGALDMILRQADKPERVRRLGEAALAAGRRGERLTRQLLAFSRRQEFKPEVLDLGAVIAGFEPMLKRAVGEAVELTVEIEPDLGAVRVDPVQFEGALLNLAVNSRDALGDSGTVRIVADRARLAEGELADTPAGDYARVRVIDTGAGMTADVMSRAFEPFFTTKGVGEGSGLGLAQVYGFARQSDGGVSLESTPGRGATVSLYLPLTDEAPVRTEPLAEPREERPLERGRRVLLVEDDLGVRTVVENLLLELGSSVLAAPDGPAALEVLRANPDVELLMTDLVMPGGMSGVDLARAASAERPGLKILLSTGYSGETLEDASAPEWPLLRKPYQAEELSQAVRKALA
ncbi:PAS domain-containing sensor histidine kinase [Caulobacter sp. 17J80-11]|uniref:PAS domain-containing hybrid sensor histidine kinase/response regulator n=1 Tax=Caulobacter sp. 17J80-11 TaxID=2763502 RepID=UPI001653CE99|nr:PAS domain-containing sensor histidine kinase [Caulobacter sp. 17J80-11]MBC6982807.1 PAS domain S-box protein [Caulobacter sp. 17J80-11]